MEKENLIYLITCFGCKAIVRLAGPKIKKLGEKRT